MEKFVDTLRRDYRDIRFVSGEIAKWSPLSKEVTYLAAYSEVALWSLLHELGHALLEHSSYISDLDLLQKEAAAWHRAVRVAEKYAIVINETHIQNCLDTYRDWVHKRSTCPHCGSHGIQPSENLYSCINCRNTWEVSSSRFCRPYRLKKTLARK